MSHPTTDIVRVFSVTSGETPYAGVRQYIIFANLVARPTQSLQLQTVNDYAASLCQRAKDLNRSIAVTWTNTKYGPTLESAAFIKTAGAA